ncbi:MAG: hypothetical protein AUK35_01935 [Zetaproteobacteria bacterium CG2_30_46_52]|nr:MAG: hypothetical protein AUK35_01935 [Zetaproteobacteria bacterium CG2_30_46_52]
MTKYIDLLRAHQQEKAKLDAHGDAIDSTLLDNVLATDETADERSPLTSKPSNPLPFANPYSHANNKTAATATMTNNDVILEESESDALPATEEVISASDILIEESDYEDPSVVLAPLTTKNMASESAQEAASVAKPTAPKPTNGAFTVANWLEQLSHTVSEIFSAAEQGQAADISPLQESLRSILEQIHESPSVVDALELEISLKITALCAHDQHNADLVQKAIMMMLYTIKTGLQLHIIHQELLNHLVAAMLHHSGMARIPANIRHKAGKLSKEEIALIRQAPEFSVAFLHQCSIDNEHIIRAVTQATERYDGSGQTGLKGFEIVWAARLIGLLSMFEALIHIRAYRPRLLPRDAIRELVNHHKKAFDPVMLKALIESISLYPVGTFVQINTGEIGLVIAIHNKFPLRPIIDISMDKYGNAITERRIDLKKQPNLMIQKCMYKEALEALRLEQVAA